MGPVISCDFLVVVQGFTMFHTLRTWPLPTIVSRNILSGHANRPREWTWPNGNLKRVTVSCSMPVLREFCEVYACIGCWSCPPGVFFDPNTGTAERLPVIPQQKSDIHLTSKRSKKRNLDEPSHRTTYGIFTYIYHENQPHLGKYTIHGSSMGLNWTNHVQWIVNVTTKLNDSAKGRRN